VKIFFQKAKELVEKELIIKTESIVLNVRQKGNIRLEAEQKMSL